MMNIPSQQQKTTNKALSVRTAIAGFALVPLLMGCSANNANTPAETETTTVTASSAETSTNTATENASATTTDSATTGVATTPAATASETAGAPQAVEDYCAGVCEEFSRTPVEHPTLGAVEIVTYGKPAHEGAAPSTYEPSYVVYKDGTPIGIYTATGQSVQMFAPDAAMGNMVWDIAVPQDKYGNLYYNTGEAIAVLTPTDTGYAQKGTLPPAAEGEPKFKVDAEIDKSTNKPLTGLTIDAEGNARIVTEYKDGKPISWEYNGSEFVQGSEPLETSQ